MSFSNQETHQKFPFSYDAVFDGLVSILPSTGMSIKSTDKLIGRISASSGMSLFSYGENLTLIIEKVDDVSSTVSMESSLKVGFNIGGAHRHQKNFDKIIQELSKFLQNPQSDLTTGGTMSNTPSDKPKTKMGWGKKIGIGCGGCILIIIIIAAIASTSTENKGSSSILLAGQTTVANALAEDQIKKYNIVKENGSAMEAAAQAGIIAEMFLQAEDKENYKKWKAIEKKEQKRAGM